MKKEQVAACSFFMKLLYFFLLFGRTTHPPDPAIEIRVLALFSRFSTFFAHRREMFGAVLGHIGLTALLRDGSIVFTSTFLLQLRPTFFSNSAIVVFTILVANRASPSAARL